MKRLLYFLCKVFFWVSILAICAYALLSVVFYFIGSDQFQNLQQTIIASRLVFLVPILFIVGFIGKILFKDDEESSGWVRRGRSRSSSFGTIATLIVIALIAFTGFLFYSNKSTAKTAKKQVAKQSSSAPSNEGKPANNDNEASKTDAPYKANASLSEKGAVNVNPVDSPVKQTTKYPLSTTNTKSPLSDTSIELAYKVVSKAYFYSSPTESARQTNYVAPASNLNAIIYPREDKNGFVYVITTNKNGRTSMGWLRKKDLKATKEIVYNDIK